MRRLVDDLNLSAIIIEHDINFIRDLKAPVTVFHLGSILVEGSFEKLELDQERAPGGGQPIGVFHPVHRPDFQRKPKLSETTGTKLEIPAWTPHDIPHGEPRQHNVPLVHRKGVHHADERLHLRPIRGSPDSDGSL